MNKALKIILIVLAAVVVLFAGLVFAAKLYFTQDRLKALVLPKVEQVLQRQVSVGQVSLKLFPNVAMRMRDLMISNPSGQTFDKPYFVKLDEIFLDVRLRPLFRRQLKIDRIILQHPQVYLELNADSVANYTLPPNTEKKKSESSKPPEQFSLLLSDLQIHDGLIEYVNKKADQRILLAGLNQQSNAVVIGGGQQAVIESNAKVNEFSYGTTQSILLSKLPVTAYKKVTYRQDQNLLTLDSVRVEISQITLTSKGTIANLDKTPRLDMTLQSSQADLGQLLSLVPPEFLKASQGLTTTGKFQFSLTVKGEVSDSTQPAVQGAFTVSDGSVRYTGLPKSVTNINVSGSFDQPAGSQRQPAVGRLEIEKLSATLGSNPLSGKLSLVNFTNPVVQATFNGQLNLSEVRDYYPLEKGTELTGLMKANLSINGPAKIPEKLKAEGRFEFQNVAIKTPTSTEPLRNLNGAITFNNQVVNAQQLSVMIGPSDLALAFSLRDYLGLVMKNAAAGKPSATVTLKSRLLRTQDLMPQEESKSTPSGQKQPSGGLLPDVNIDANVTIDKLIADKFEFTNVCGAVKIRNGVINLDNLSLNAFEGSVVTNGSLDLRPDKKNAFDFDFNINNVEANALLPKFTTFGTHLFGKFTLNGTFKGSLNDTLGLDPKTLTGDGKVQVQQGKLVGYPLTSALASFTGLSEFQQVDFTQWASPYKITNGRLDLGELKIASKNADFVLNGTQGLDGSLDYKLLLKLPDTFSSRLKISGLGSELLSVLKDKDGKINLNFLVKGTALKPALSLDQKSLEAAAQAALKQKINQEKQKLEDELMKKAQEQLQKLLGK